ncbi:MAG: hypothetical protein QW607_02535 [Desulfurococcaceae archaeon]
MSIRMISQIIVSIVLISVAIVTTITSGLIMTRFLSSYKPHNIIIVRIGEPTIDVIPTSQGIHIHVSHKLMNLGDEISIFALYTQILLKGTTGKSILLSCRYVAPGSLLLNSQYPLSLPPTDMPTDIPVLLPGEVISITSVCSINRTDIINLFTSSWSSDLVEANTYYLYSRIFYIQYYKVVGVGYASDIILY